MQPSDRDTLDPAVFRAPGARYQGVALWFLNDLLDPDEAVRQLRGLRDAGWGAVITRTFMGIRTPYLSPEWNAFTDRVIEAARDLGIRVFLQHADKNAAGYMASGVPGMQERFRHKLLVCAPADAHLPPHSEALARTEGHAYYAQAAVAPGDWAKLMAVLDLLDEETVAAYLRAAYDPLAERWGHEFGKTVEAIWVDEPWLRIARYSPFPSLPWTPRLPALFESDWGYSLLEHLPSLFHPIGDYRRVRYHFWQTVTRQFLRAYWQAVGDWCDAHGVGFAGHLMSEDTLHGQISWTAAVMPSYAVMHLPGIDHLTRNLQSWPAGTKFILTPKQCSSAANQLGRKEVLSEIYGVSDQGLTFEDRKWMAEWLAALGINYRCYHGAFYSMRGRRKRFYPPHLSEQQPWWPENRRVADPMARLSYLLRQGAFEADILVLHPLESAHCEFAPEGAAPAVQAMQRSWAALSENLLAIHRSYDYGDEHLMAKLGRVSEGRLHVGEMAYRVVILPEVVTLRGSTLRFLTELLDAGGVVLSVGALPERVDGTLDPRIRQLNARIVSVPNTPEALREALDARHPADLALSGAGAERVWLHSRRVGNRRILFLTHTDRTATVEATLRIRGTGRLEAWGLETGEVEPAAQESCDGWTVAPLTFPPGGSHLLVFDEEAAPVTVARPKPVETRTFPLRAPFSVTRQDPNALTLDFCRWRRGDGPWEARIPVIGVQEKLEREGYRGPVELLFEFEAAERPAACDLVAEDTEQCEITLNGRRIERAGASFYRDRGFHRLNATAHVRAGRNEVRIRREFVPPDPGAIRDPERLYGTELESIYVIGDFAVVPDGSGGFSLAPEKARVGGDLPAEGYPFFAGVVTLSADLELPAPEPGERVFLDLGALHAVLAKVRVNGADQGALLWAPYEVEITGAVRPGANRVEIELVNSLRNLLGPHHYTGPRKQEVWEFSFTGKMERADWMDLPHRADLKTWSDAYQFAAFGCSEGIRVVYRREVGA